MPSSGIPEPKSQVTCQNSLYPIWDFSYKIRYTCLSYPSNTSTMAPFLTPTFRFEIELSHSPAGREMLSLAFTREGVLLSAMTEF